jgi:hypothetical protein
LLRYHKQFKQDRWLAHALTKHDLPRVFLPYRPNSALLRLLAIASGEEGN